MPGPIGLQQAIDDLPYFLEMKRLDQENIIP